MLSFWAICSEKGDGGTVFLEVFPVFGWLIPEDGAKLLLFYFISFIHTDTQT